MCKKIISLLLLLLFASSSMAAAHSALIQIGGMNKYKSVRLTPEIYSNTNINLSDILIKDSKGEAVPYFINTNLQKLTNEQKTYPLQLNNAYIKDNNFYFDYRLATNLDSDTLATSIEFTTTSLNFAKLVGLYGSYDNLHWEFIQDDKLYAIDDKVKLYISFNKPQKYTYYRLRLSNNLEKISFSKAQLFYNIHEHEQTYFIETLTPEFEVEQKDKTTFVKISGLKNLRLCDLHIDTDSTFKRMAQAPYMPPKEIFNLSINGTVYADTTLQLNRQIARDDAYTITIRNNDDKPIKINAVTVRYYADEIIFDGSADSQYTLYFGADTQKTAPIYDIVKYKNEILSTPIDRLQLAPVNYDHTEQSQPDDANYKDVFNIVIVAITFLLGGLILYRLKNKS